MRADAVGAGGTGASSPSPVHSPEPGYALQKVTGKDVASPRIHSTTRQPRMTSTVYSSYTRGPAAGSALSQGPAEMSSVTGPRPLPHPKATSSHTFQGRKAQHRAQDTGAPRWAARLSESHVSPSRSGRRSSWKAGRLNKQVPRSPAGFCAPAKVCGLSKVSARPALARASLRVAVTLGQAVLGALQLC